MAFNNTNNVLPFDGTNPVQVRPANVAPVNGALFNNYVPNIEIDKAFLQNMRSVHEEALKRIDQMFEKVCRENPGKKYTTVFNHDEEKNIFTAYIIEAQ